MESVGIQPGARNYGKIYLDIENYEETNRDSENYRAIYSDAWIYGDVYLISKTMEWTMHMSLRLGRDTDGGIGGQHIHPTDSEIVITIF